MLRTATLTLVLVALISGYALAQAKTVFVVRHAERADTEAGKSEVDPSLSETGRRRAQSLAAALKDARITAILVTEFKRTQETAAPLAQAIGVTPAIVSSKDLPGLIASIHKATGSVLVVGHSNSVPGVIKALGVTTPVTVGDAEFDQLFIVAPDTANLIQLRYR